MTMISGSAGAPMLPPSTKGGGGADAAPVTGGGGVDASKLVPVMQQLVTALNSLVSALQAKAGAAGVSGGGGTVAGANGAGAGAQAGAAGCGCGGGGAAGAPVPVSMEGAGGAPKAEKKSGEKKSEKSEKKKSEGASGGGGKLDGSDLTVKGTKIDGAQRANLEKVLQVGTKMGANEKVLKSAIATVIQESVARNDSSVDSKDLDSLGLFQQRPSQGWGTRKQISDPVHAATKYFEQAIKNDKKNPDLAITRLAQSVQRSAFPDAYAKWDKEAAKIVADFKS